MTPERASFFMPDLIIVPEEKSTKKDVSLKPEPKAPPKEFKVPKVKLAEGIKAYDKKVKEIKNKVYTENPYDYNSVSLKPKEGNIQIDKSAEEMLVDPTYNTIGKLFGIDTIHDWGKYYEKIYNITEWAKDETQTDDVGSLVEWIANKTKELPNLGAKNIDNLFIFAGIHFNKK